MFGKRFSCIYRAAPPPLESGGHDRAPRGAKRATRRPDRGGGEGRTSRARRHGGRRQQWRTVQGRRRRRGAAVPAVQLQRERLAGAEVWGSFWWDQGAHGGGGVPLGEGGPEKLRRQGGVCEAGAEEGFGDRVRDQVGSRRQREGNHREGEETEAPARVDLCRVGQPDGGGVLPPSVRGDPEGLRGHAQHHQGGLWRPAHGRAQVRGG